MNPSHVATLNSDEKTDLQTVLFESGVLPEPNLIFGGGQEHPDPKFGLGLFGPYCTGQQARPVLTSINVGIIGPGAMVSDTERWLEACQNRLSNKGERPILAPMFPGISSDHPFQCSLICTDAGKYIIPQDDLKQALALPSFTERVGRIIEIYSKGIETLDQRDPRPNIVLCCLPQEIVDNCTVKKTKSGDLKRKKTSVEKRSLKKTLETGQGFLFSSMDPTHMDNEDLITHSNLRRGLKACAMQHDMPTQIVWPRTLSLIDSDDVKTAQDIATRAWNFVGGLYYKAGGTPWRLATSEPHTCYVGISFYKELNKPEATLRTSMAQMFTSSGDGYVLRGNAFKWDSTREKSRSPHLDYNSAKQLIKDVIDLYKQQNNKAVPSRIVIHKSSRYWDEELRGFKDGCQDISRVDLVAFGWRGIQFYRTGIYPPLRGTYIKFNEKNQLLYTVGYVPFQRTYNGPRVPQPIEILEHFGDTPWLDILREILSLTKLNWNTTNFACSEPITLAFARKVGEILAELGDNMHMKNEYRYYM